MCFRHFKFHADCFPVTLVFITLLWSYYVFVYEICVLLVVSKLVFLLYMIFYHFLLVIVLLMYFVCMCHRGYVVPAKFLLPIELLDELHRNKGNEEMKYDLLVDFCKRKRLLVYTRVPHSGGIRYCTICNVLKPDRAHHCNVCNRCILRMDHHCSWLHNCIGFSNYKSFMMLLLYSSVYCLYYFTVSLFYSIRFLFHWDHFRHLSIIFNCLLALILFIVLSALLIFHVKLIMGNDTILEIMYRPSFYEPHCTFDAGWKTNFYNHCTWSPLNWILPVNTMSGTGAEFDVYRD